ncbi:hypothetical protein EG68_10996 [Paragonimus skrjabini miyazakii]|uniref:Amiloride-sensitive sodium channel n=1 Tax=Paragonimus skrjabini miyazakii TaxID=59628 RepID=A0A8S9YFD7_9TREM|nr:hypothetical protein EG68_10996 [Paragonimus skrjabini miyazakii]
MHRVMASQLTGARLLLHPRASYPRVAEEGINLMPGTMTDIRFSVYEWSMMEPPHGRCSSKTPDSIHFNNVNYSYSEEACHSLKQQEQIAARCNCLAQWLPVPTHLMSKGLRKCEVLKFPATHDVLQDFTRAIELYFNTNATQTFYEYASCAQRISMELDSQKTGCRPACIRYTYRPSITAAQWPTKTFLTWFVTKSLRRLQLTHVPNSGSLNITHRDSLPENVEELRKLLTPYEEIANLTRQGRQEEAIQKLMSLQTFERNFLSIVISRPNFDLERIEEKAVVSLTSLFSQIGGLLSIWIGLTLICIVELVEFGLNLIDIVRHYRNRPK